MGLATAIKSTAPVPKKRRQAKRPTTAALRTFLERLSLTANVTAAAKAAKLNTKAVYTRRGRDAGFRAAWHAALCEGYARLETELLAEALAPPEPELDDGLAKARLYKQRLALALLAAHRASVRGERTDVGGRRPGGTTGAKAQLAETINTMVARSTEGAPAAAAQGIA